MPDASLLASFSPDWPMSPNTVIMPMMVPTSPSSGAMPTMISRTTRPRSSRTISWRAAVSSESTLSALGQSRCVAASRSRRPSGDGFSSQSPRRFFTSSGVRHSASRLVIGGGTTLFQRNIQPRQITTPRPREGIELMGSLLIAPDEETINDPGRVINILDPACGTGGMLTAAEDKIESINRDAKVYLFGQEVNGESWAVCESEMLLRNQSGDIHFGNTFSDPAFAHMTFDYMLANPPFGVEWKKVKDAVENEAETGYAGRFGAGLPRINDGSFLFLQHMLSKMQPVEDRGARLAIVFNGSPLFTGAAGSGESEIRRWILENDWLEGIVALPDQLFYNTGISTYFWILSNRKAEELRGKVILLDARDQWEKMRKSFGNKRKQISANQIKHITELHMNALSVAADAGHSDYGKVKIFSTRDFGYHRITVERPLKLRFEITEDTMAAIGASKPLVKWDWHDGLVTALRGLLGTVWWTKKEASAALHAAARSGGVLWPSTASLQKAIWSAVSVSDPEGEVQKSKDGSSEPDPDLRDYENVPLKEASDAFLPREISPHPPDP